MPGQWELKELRGPQRIRPETDWFQQTRPRKRVSDDAYGRGDGGLWFSLQLRPDRAKELYERNPNGVFGKLIEGGAQMAPTSRTALKFVLDSQKSGTIGTDVLVPKKAFAALEALSKDGIEISDAGLAVDGEISALPLAVNEQAKSIPGPIPKDSPVIIATIDDGIGIANHRFRQTAKTTRIRHFLDLALIGKPMTNGWSDELLGRSWKGKNIDNLLGQEEEQIYRALGLIDPTSQLRQPLLAAVTHGTHVLDLAAGYDWQTEAEAVAAEARPIIAVQLPTQVGQTRSDTWLPQSLKRALDWILVKADELSAELSERPAPGEKPRRLPLVVNGSFASMAGPQDGAGDVERRITQFVKTYRGVGPEDLCTLVLSAGNSLQLCGQAQMDVPQGETRKIPWRVQPDGKTPSFVEIWLPDDVGGLRKQQVEVSLVPPGEDPASAPPSQLDAAVEWKIGGYPGARIYHQRLPRSRGSRECITIAILPTAEDQEGDPVVPSGEWHIKIKNIDEHHLHNIDLRVHLNEVGMFSRSGARQSYFDDRRYEMFDPGSGRIINDELKDPPSGTRVTRQGTLSSYAYANGVLAVGGYRLSDDQPAIYSSSGRRPDNPALGGSSSASDVHYRTEDANGNLLDGPDFAAVSEESPALTGVLAAGTYSGSVAILSGTSVAAPQVTRALADQIAKRATPGQPKAALVQSLRPGPPRPLRDGVGRLSFKTSYPKRIGD